MGGRTIGLVGLGGIGRALIERLKGFNVRIVGIKNSNPSAVKAELGLDWVGGPDQLPELLRQSDFVFLCLPVTPD